MVPGCSHDEPTPGCIWCWSDPDQRNSLTKFYRHDDEQYRRNELRVVRNNRHDRRKAEALKRRA
jgi:hypothetical protein